MKVHFSTIHRAEIQIPEDVYQEYGHTQEYEIFSCNVAAYVDKSGSQSYSDVIEYAECSDLDKLKIWVKRWEEQISIWKSKL